MTTTPIEYDPATGDTTVNGRLFREVYPITAEYAALAPWNAADEPIVFRGQWYRRYALPRVIGHTEIVPIDVFQGVTVFAEPGASTRHPEVIYLPFTPDCQFQPYEIAEIAGAVRG
ncbi:MAG TPA: hypothetical protein VFS20_13870 [Longimicrobium sp.]|nr:hypothetical protein [Longimicrobium sp.]